MLETRREVIKGLIASVAGAGVLSGCVSEWLVTPTAPGRPARTFTVQQFSLLERLSDLIIPRTSTPGALDANVPGFIDGLMFEWADANTRESFQAGIEAIHLELSQRAGGEFLSAEPITATKLLTKFDADSFTGGAGELERHYRNIKSLIVESYFASEQGARQELQWPAVPGRWEGCKPLLV